MKHDENQISSAKAAATEEGLTGAELERIATVHMRRTKQVAWSMVPGLLFFPLMYFIGDEPSTHELRQSIVPFFFMAIALWGTMMVWKHRCPRCNGYLSGDLLPKFCRKCGVRLMP